MEPETIKSISELFSPGKILFSALVLFLAWLTIRASFWLLRVLTRQFGRQRLQIARVFPVLRLTVWSIALYLVIGVIFSPEEQSVLAILAALGLALGLAAQDVIRNVLSGIFILFDQPFQVGDMIKVGDDYGEVMSIGLRSVRIRTFEDSMVTIPNSMVLSQAVSNSNSGALDEMIVVEFRLPATINVQEVKELAWEAAASSPYIYLKKPISVIVDDEFDRTFLTRFKVKCYVLDVRYERLLASDILERIKREILEREMLDETVVLGLLAREQGEPAAEVDRL